MEDKITINSSEYIYLLSTDIKYSMLINSLFDNCSLSYDNENLKFNNIEQIIKLMYLDRYRTKVIELKRKYNNVDEQDN